MKSRTPSVNAQPVAASSLIDQAHWHGVYWRGTEAQIIEAGLCRPDQFPGREGGNKISQTERDGDRKLTVKRLGRRFEVYLSNEEILARSTADFRRFIGAVLEPVPCTEGGA